MKTRKPPPKKPLHCIAPPSLSLSAELVQQVTRVCKALSKAGARFKSSAMTGGQPSELERSKCFRTQRELLKDGVDVVSRSTSLLDDPRIQIPPKRVFKAVARC